jgi:hypothetical protein
VQKRNNTMRPPSLVLPLLLLLVAATSGAAAPPTTPPPPPAKLSPSPTVVPPGQDVVITATAQQPGVRADQLALFWRLNFGEERQAAGATTASPPSSFSFSFAIPLASSGAKQGDLLRWRLRVNDAATSTYDPPEVAIIAAGGQAAAPPASDARRRYCGALVSSSPSALTPAPRLPLEPSITSEANLALLASPALPEIHWWHPNETAATSDGGAPGGAIYLPAVLRSSNDAPATQQQQQQGSFHDAVRSERRGVTALAWPKPKLKFELEKNAQELFPVAYAPSANNAGVRELRLNSHYTELGDGPSHVREAVALAVLAESGVAAPRTHYVRLFLNGRLLGLFSVVEGIEDGDGQGFLARRGLAFGANAPLFESVSGELSNLRGDLPVSELASFYGKTGNPQNADDWKVLDRFVRGLAGTGAPGDTSSSSSSPLLTRRLFALDALNLPSIVNEAAAQTILGNMDRCTKNFYVYRDPSSLQWHRFPWDVEASLGQDSGLGGKPGDLYCVLACEQWNSPLYCDAQHPQDTERASGVPELNTYFGAERGAAKGGGGGSGGAAGMGGAGGSPQITAAAGESGGRRRHLAQTASSRLPAEGPPLQPGGWPEPTGWADPDAVPPGLALVRLGAAAGTTPVPRRGSGAAFTYNHLTAALLDVPETRAMYLRRLRTLADAYYGAEGGNGTATEPRMARLVRAHWTKVERAARESAKLWAQADPGRGIEQLLREYVPIRARQLLGTYAPGGVRPLLPSSASLSSQTLRLARFERDGGNGSGAFLEIANDADGSRGAESAVDASGWAVRFGTRLWRLPHGAVVPGGRSLYLARDVQGFGARGVSPRGGEGRIVVPVVGRGGGSGGGGAKDDGASPPGAAVGDGPLPVEGGSKWELLDGRGQVVSVLG